MSCFIKMTCFTYFSNLICIPAVNGAYKASVIYQLKCIWSIFRDNIHHPNILVLQSSCKRPHVWFHIHHIPQSVWFDLWTQEIPIILNSVSPKFLHNKSNTKAMNSFNMFLSSTSIKQTVQNYNLKRVNRVLAIVPYPFQTFHLNSQNQQVEEEELSI